MKTFTKICSIMMVILTVSASSAFSVKHTILVGNFFFNPVNLTGVNPGDTVRWQWQAGTHTTTSSTIPVGAAPWDELITSSIQSYEYVPLITGTYDYVCTPHVAMGMVGSFTVTAAAPLTVSVSADPPSLCQGQSTMLFSFPSGGTGSYSYSWTSSPAGFTSNQQNPQATPSVTTQYTCTVTSGSQTATASVTVTVQGAATASAGTDVTYCDNIGSFPVSGTASNYSAVSWTTSGDGTFTNGNTLNDTYMPGPNDLLAGWVNLILQANPVLPCTAPATDTVHITFILCTGTEEAQNGRIPVSVFPNPASGQVTLQSGLTETGTVRIFDIRGRMVHEEAFGASASGVKRMMDLTGFPSGIYQVTVTSATGTGSVRILVR